MKQKNQLLHTMILTLIIAFAVPVQGEELNLKNCIERAIINNPIIAEAKFGMAAGEKTAASAQAKHFPKLSLDMNYNLRQNPVPFIPAQSVKIPAHFSSEYSSWGALITLPLYQGGQISANVELAEVRKELLNFFLLQTRNDLIANTVNTFYKILQLQQLKKASQASVVALYEQVKNAQLLLNLGRMAKVDFLKVKVQLANEEQRLLTLDELISTTEASLYYLMGDNELYRKKDRLVLIINSPPDEAASISHFDPDDKRLFIKRPEYQSAVKAVEEAGLNHKIASGKILPSVNAMSGYIDQYGTNPWYREANWFFSFQVSVNLFDRSLYTDISREKIFQDKAKAHLKAVENQLRLEVKNALASIRDSARRVETSRQVIEQAHESFRIEREKYNTGAGTMSELLLAQAADMTAESNLSQAMFDHNFAIVSFRKATGVLEEYLK